MAVYKAPGIYVEQISSLKRSIAAVETTTAAFVGLTMRHPVPVIPTLVTSYAEYEREFGGTFDAGTKSGAIHVLPLAVSGFFENGGKRLFVMPVIAHTNGVVQNQDYISALATLETTPGINIVAIPGQTATAVQQALLAHCEKMRYRFAILDPVDAEINAVLNQRKSIDSSFGALYFPRLRVVDPSDGSEVMLPPSGHVAGIYVRTDHERGVHKAPANEIVRGISGLEVICTAAQQERFNPVGVNVIRDFRRRGLRVWGARTVSSDPEQKYVNVRRLLSYIEESIETSTQWVVFEPNGERLWAEIRTAIESFLMSVWRNGMLMGQKSEQAFFVRCDRSTMTQNDIDNGRLICQLGIAPVRPAEFVILKMGWRASS